MLVHERRAVEDQRREIYKNSWLSAIWVAPQENLQPLSHWRNSSETGAFCTSIGNSSEFPIEVQKALRAGAHWVGKELCR